MLVAETITEASEIIPPVIEVTENVLDTGNIELLLEEILVKHSFQIEAITFLTKMIIVFMGLIVGISVLYLFFAVISND